jgi:hypothetical protein
MRNKQSVVSGTMQPPTGPTTTHVHEASRAAVIFAYATVAAIALPLLWFFACGIASELGSEQPGRDVAIFCNVGGKRNR